MNISEEIENNISQFTHHYNEKRSKLTNEIDSLFNEYIDPIELIIDDINVESVYNRLKDRRTPPQLMHIGKMNIENSTRSIPALISYMRSSATLFVNGVNKNFDTETINLFQLMTLRVLSTLHHNSVDFLFFDTKSYGRKFNIIGKLHEDIQKKCEIIDDSDKIQSALKKLEEKVRKTALGMKNKEWLDEYNLSNDTVLPYTFVFISDYPNGFSSDDRKIVGRLIDECNATKAGIYLFLSENSKEDTNNNQIYYGSEGLAEHLNYLHSNCQVISYLNDYDVLVNNDESIYDNTINELYNIQLDKLNDNKILDKCIDKINEVCHYVTNKQKSSLENSYLQAIKKDIWSRSSFSGLSFEVGYLDNGDPFKLEFANGTSDYFAAIGGRPGSGKTVLIHNIILSGAINYSPDELLFYLFDYANGSSFIGYDKLPHVKVLSITKEREYGVSTLKSVFDEMEHRSALFKDATKKYNQSISKYEDYRQITNQMLPRIVIIIDEFQVLISNNDKLSNTASKAIENIIKEARKFGIHIVLCTQKYSGLDVDISLVTQRIAFNLSTADSEKLLGNNEAYRIDKVGNAIANNMNGEKGNNIPFRCMFFNNIPHVINEIASKPFVTELNSSRRMVFDSIVESNITSCSELLTIINEHSIVNHPVIYLGTPKYISDKDIRIILKNTYKSNVLYIGDDQESVIKSILNTTFQILQQSSIDSHTYIVNNLNSSDPAFTYEELLKNKPENLTFHSPIDLDSIIEKFYDELQNRLKIPTNIDFPRIIFAGINLDSLRQFRDNRISYGNDNNDTKSKFLDILKNGPDYNIHTILYVTSTNGLINLLGSSSNIDLFSYRIISRGIQDIRGISTLRVEDLPTKSYHCYLHVDDSVEASKLIFNPAPFVIYNKQSYSISKYIDSIINLFDN